MKFDDLKINGYPAYQASDEEIVNAYLKAEDEESQTTIAKYYIESRLKYRICRDGENRDTNFGRLFEDFVNGQMLNPRTVAERMSHSHRYLVQEMFNVCFEYTRILAGFAEKGLYDPRDEWACKTAQQMWDAVKETYKGMYD